MQAFIERLTAVVLIGLSAGAIALAAGSSSAVHRPVQAAPPSSTSQADSAEGEGSAARDGRAFLGIEVEDAANGARVRSVQPNSPAQRAGVQTGDVITAVGGDRVGSARELVEAIARRRPGESVDLTVARGGQDRTVRVTLGTRTEPAPPPAAQPGPFGLVPGLKPFEGIPPSQWFDHLKGGTLNLTDKNGNPLTLRILPGEVTAVTADSVTLKLNSGGSATFKVTADTAGPRRGGGPRTRGLAVGDKVVILAAENSDTALAIIGREVGRGLGGLTPMMPGFRDGPGFEIPLPGGSGSFRFFGPSDELPSDLQQWLQDMRKRMDKLQQNAPRELPPGPGRPRSPEAERRL